MDEITVSVVLRREDLLSCEEQKESRVVVRAGGANWSVSADDIGRRARLFLEAHKLRRQGKLQNEGRMPKLNFALKRAIIESNMPAYDVAHQADLSETTLSRIVRGRRPASDEEMAALARVLERTVSELFEVQHD